MSFWRQPFQAECTQTHSNGTVSLTFTYKTDNYYSPITDQRTFNAR